MKTTGDLSEKLRTNTLTQIQEAEKAVQTALNDLSESMTHSLQNELHTLRQGMAAQLKNVEQDIQAFHTRSNKQTGLYSLLCIMTLAILCGGMTFFTGWSQGKATTQRNALKAEIMELEQSVEKLNAKNLWGVQPVEGQNGRFLVLPQGMKADTGWTVGESPAIKLEE